jgi:aspartate dehydrogenase
MARKKRLKIALIGYGAISQTLFDIFREKKPDIDIIGVLVRPGRAKETQKKVGRKVPVVETLRRCSSSSPTSSSRRRASRRCATGARSS